MGKYTKGNMKKEISQEVAYELLEALKNLANQTVMTEYNADVFKKARQAIAKAEGE